MKKFKSVEQFLNTKQGLELKEKINSKQIGELSQILEKYSYSQVFSRKNIFKNFLDYNVDDNWFERFEKIILLGKDSATLKSFILRYGDEFGPKFHEEKTKKSTSSLENCIRIYGENGEKRWKEICKSKKSIGIEVMIKRHGEEEGKRRWEEYLSKWKPSMQKSKEENGWTSDSRSLKKHIEKYGEEEGLKSFQKIRDNHSYKMSKQYFLDTFGDQAEEKYNEYCKGKDHLSINYFIKKYGEDDGRIKYETFCQKMIKSSSREGVIERYGEEEGERRWKENIDRLLKASNIGKTASKISQELFWKIYNLIDINEREECEFFELSEKEFTFYVYNDNINFIKVDFKFKNYIIEFYGDYWHCNPNKYKEDDKAPKTTKIKTVKDVWEKDKSRIKILEEKGYKCLIVWEDDYKKNKKEVVDCCLKFLNL